MRNVVTRETPVGQASGTDPVTIAVVYNALTSACHEMHLTLTRTSYSPNVKQRGDCSTCVLGATGEVWAHAPDIKPIHLGSMMGALDFLFKECAREDMQPGDMWLANDPYSGGGQHLPDFNVIAPVFVEGRLAAFVANTAHHADVGGMIAGSEAIVSRSIYQDGLRVPLVRILRAGDLVEDVLRIIMLNSRRPGDRRGDVLAQIAANRVGVRRLEEVYARVGPETVPAAMTEYLDYTEARFRSRIAALPDGSYSAEDHLDPDLNDVRHRPVRIALKVTKAGTRLAFDFMGTDGQLPNSSNAPYNAVKTAVYTVVKNLIDPQLPDNSGYFRAIDVSVPLGTVLNPRPGAAVGARAFAASIVGDVVADAISQMLPSRALAASGPHLHVVFTGEQSQNESWVDYETVAGGYGARPYKDGTDGVRVHVAGSLNLPVEILEQAYPLRVERYELRNDSGGPGRYRGGMGLLREYRALAAMTVSLSGHRCVVAAKGIDGGSAGAVGEFLLDAGSAGERRLPSAMGELSLAPGQILSVCTPGGGGVGDPKKRDHLMVARDVDEGRITASAASQFYSFGDSGAAVPHPRRKRQHRSLAGTPKPS